ncbi:unnamed protein product [Lupinus luteus]|uniref:Uncharacterized protein n=1 Tax=Lupinus luteus TaxID=3873 RepID=A0AAV1WE92_LUPLU
MDESEFQRLLQLFPVVRSPHYCVESASSSSRQIASGSAQDEVVKEWHDAWDERDNGFQSQGIQNDSFWRKLNSEAAEKVGAEEAERFCKAFKQIHKKLVYEELSLDAAQSFINSS